MVRWENTVSVVKSSIFNRIFVEFEKWENGQDLPFPATFNKDSKSESGWIVSDEGM